MYNGPSIDECCLLDMSKTAKVIEFLKKPDSESMVLKNHVSGQPEDWELVRTFPFESDRKAMSVIVRDRNTKRVFVHVKGADSSILPKVTHSRGEKSIHPFIH